MKQVNLHPVEVQATIIQYCPDFELQSNLYLRALKCLMPHKCKDRDWIKGEQYEVWVCQSDKEYCLVFPGYEGAYIVDKRNWESFENAPELKRFTLKVKNADLGAKEIVYDYAVVPYDTATPLLIPSWWLDISKMEEYYFINRKDLTCKLEFILENGYPSLCWKFVSPYIDGGYQRFDIMEGKFMPRKEYQVVIPYDRNHYGSYMGVDFCVKDKVLTFKL